MEKRASFCAGHAMVPSEMRFECGETTLSLREEVLVLFLRVGMKSGNGFELKLNVVNER